MAFKNSGTRHKVQQKLPWIVPQGMKQNLPEMNTGCDECLDAVGKGKSGLSKYARNKTARRFKRTEKTNME